MKKVIVAMIIIITFLLTISLTYAWFTTLKTSNPIIFNTGSLTADLKLYQGIDENNDNIIDEYVLVTDNISFQNVIPGETFYFRVFVKNEGSIDGNLDFYINDIIYSDLDFLSGFSIIFIDPNTNIEKEISLGVYQEKINIFNSVILEEQEEFIFDFAINANKSLSDEGNLQITSFVIKLEQIH